MLDVSLSVGMKGGHMKVLEGVFKGVAPGDTISLAELGLPVKGIRGLLIVFWKSL